MLPVEIIKIIVDYIPDESFSIYSTLDILPSIEKIFNLKKLVKEIKKCYRYDDCNCHLYDNSKEYDCPYIQKKYPEDFHYFRFHPYYPSSFLSWMIENCFPEMSRKKVNHRTFSNQNKFDFLSLELTNVMERKNKVPVDTRANVDPAFLKNYVDQKYHHLYQNDDPLAGAGNHSNKINKFGQRSSWKDNKKDTDKEPNFRFNKTSKLSSTFMKEASVDISYNHDILQNVCLTEEFVEENLSAIDIWKWELIMSNPSMSSDFILRHLERFSVEEKSNVNFFYVLLDGIMKHPSFSIFWKSYLRFIPDECVTLLKHHQDISDNFYLCEDFFKAYPQFFKTFIKRARVSEEFLASEYKFPGGGSTRKFSNNTRFDIFKNEHIGQSTISNLLQNFLNEEKENDEYKLPKELVKILNNNHSLTDDFWEEHQDLICHGESRSLISCNPKLSAKFIAKHKEKLNLVYVFQHNKLLPIHFLKRAFTNFLAKTF
jgi:hypothetical protein